MPDTAWWSDLFLDSNVLTEGIVEPGKLNALVLIFRKIDHARTFLISRSLCSLA
jgi:hypothetical protein